MTIRLTELYDVVASKNWRNVARNGFIRPSLGQCFKAYEHFEEIVSNIAPVANPDSVTVMQNSSVIINLLANDTDPNSDTLAITNLTTPAHGSLTNHGNGTVTYTPVAEYSGEDSFDYTISDNHGGTSTSTASITVTLEAYTLLRTLDNPNTFSTTQQDALGNTVSICESYSIAGVSAEDSIGGIQSGVVYIFNNNDNSLRFTLENPNPYGGVVGDYFGLAVSICEPYALVGTYQEDDATGNTVGKAYLFNNSDGTLKHTISNPNVFGNATDDYFAFSVAVSPSYSLMGAPGEDTAEYSYAGKAYLFNNSDGTLKYTFDNPNPFGTPTQDYFGKYLDVCESYSLISSYREDSEAGLDIGMVYIFSNTTGALLHSLTTNTPFTQIGLESIAISETYSAIRSGGNTNGQVLIYNNSTGSLVRTIDNPNVYGDNSDYFGQALDITDTHLVVGSKAEDDASGNGSGAVYIFNIVTGALLHTIVNPNPYSTGVGDNFGWAVGISNSYVIAGAPNESDLEGISSGKVYTFNLSDGSLKHTFDNPNVFGTSSDDLFGISTAINNNYFVVGASGEGSSGLRSTGKVYLFNSSTGNLVRTIENPIVTADGRFGKYITMSGDNLAVGVESSEKVCIFRASTGELIHTLYDPNTYGNTIGDSFGHALAINSTKILVGAYGEDTASFSASGAAYIFNLTTGDLEHTLVDPNPDGLGNDDQFGLNVAMCESYSAVSAPREDTASGADSGKVYIYNNSNGNLIYTLSNPNAFDTEAGDQFGQAVSICESFTAVGTPYEKETGGYTYSGKVYIFNNSNGVLFRTLDNPNTYSTPSADKFGTSVAINETYTVVGVPDEDDANGTISGVVYVFKNSDGSLIASITNPNASGLSQGDAFGISVNIDNNNTVVVGAYSESDATGVSSGKVYVFIING